MKFREVRVREIKEIKKEKEEEKAYLKIKPKTDITIEECNEFIRKLYFGEGI